MVDSSYLQWTEHLGAKSVPVIYPEYDYIYEKDCSEPLSGKKCANK